PLRPVGAVGARTEPVVEVVPDVRAGQVDDPSLVASDCEVARIRPRDHQRSGRARSGGTSRAHAARTPETSYATLPGPSRPGIGRQPPENVAPSALHRPRKTAPIGSVVIVSASPSISQRYGIAIPAMLG